MPDSTVLERLETKNAASDIAAFFAARAPEVDGDAADLRDSLKWLAEHGLLDLGLGTQADASPDRPGLEPFGEVVAAVAEHCMASAFGLWCHRMVMEYVHAAEGSSFPRAQLLERLKSVDVLGSTALGTAMAHIVTGSPLSVTFREDGDELVLDGRIAWASNLLAETDAAITVTAAVDEAGKRILVAVPLDSVGLEIAPYPRLLALQATRSSTVRLTGVRVPRGYVVTEEFATALPRIRPTFLSLQSSFCWGLARASLAGARAELRGTDEALAGDLELLESELARSEAQLRKNLRTPDARQMPMRTFVQTRLDMAQLAGAATRLELTVRGGRAYRIDDPAGRRFREAAFLPVQAPTEGQLRWELARSA